MSTTKERGSARGEPKRVPMACIHCRERKVKVSCPLSSKMGLLTGHSQCKPFMKNDAQTCQRCEHNNLDCVFKPITPQPESPPPESRFVSTMSFNHFHSLPDSSVGGRSGRSSPFIGSAAGQYANSQFLSPPLAFQQRPSSGITLPLPMSASTSAPAAYSTQSRGFQQPSNTLRSMSQDTASQCWGYNQPLGGQDPCSYLSPSPGTSQSLMLSGDATTSASYRGGYGYARFPDQSLTGFPEAPFVPSPFAEGDMNLLGSTYPGSASGFYPADTRDARCV